MACIGIDLGTTYTCAAVFQHEQATVITNTRGNRTTPSWVAFRKKELLVGETAKGQAGRNARNTIYDSKRMIGRRFDDAMVARDTKLWPFKVGSRNHMACAEVEWAGIVRQITPEQVSAAILAHIKEAAAAFLGRPVDSAVITVPAYFNDSQRQATKHAAKIAGLRVERILNEPTAAAICYGLLNRKESVDSGQSATGSGSAANQLNALVFDFGGGTLDVTVLTLESDVLEVLSTCGDTHLGGQDVDNELMRFCAQKFKDRTGVDVWENAKAVKRLRDACQEAKHALSTADSTYLEVEALAGGEDFEMELTLATFNEINRTLFKSTLEPVKIALTDAKLSANQIEEIILIGGSTRIRKIQELLEEFFDGKQLCKRINPDEAVAIGAAIHAANLSPVEERSAMTAVVLMDVTPMTLGIELAGGKMSVIIPRNSTLPYTHTRVYKNNEDNQEEAHILVYEGESPYVAENRLLGSFVVENLPQRPRGKVSISVTFSVSTDGIMEVSGMVKDDASSASSITIKQDKGLLSEEEIGRFGRELANDWALEPPSEEQEKLIGSLLAYAEKLESQLDEAEMSGETRQRVQAHVREAKEWCLRNPYAHPEDVRRYALAFRSRGRAIITHHNAAVE